MQQDAQAENRSVFIDSQEMSMKDVCTFFSQLQLRQVMTTGLISNCWMKDETHILFCSSMMLYEHYCKIKKYLHFTDRNYQDKKDPDYDR
jgi:hypothetical protein